VPAVKRGNAVSPPQVPGDAPAWFHPFGNDTQNIIEQLQRQIAALEARLKAAGIA